MKIKKLWVSEYKNLKDVYLDFSPKLISLFVGRNGLGKSNLIEVLALIFRKLENAEKDTDLINWAAQNFQFEIVYECNKHEITIELRENEQKSKGIELKVSVKLIGPHFSIIIDDFNTFKGTKQLHIPKYIIGYYSGENKRVKEIVKKQEQIVYDQLLKQARNPDKEYPDSMRRMFFSENHHAKMILLTLCIYSRVDRYQKLLNELLLKHLNIESVPEFWIKFNNPPWNYDNIGGVNKGIDHVVANIQDGDKRPFWNIAGKVNRLLTAFYNFQLNISEPVTYPNEGDGKDERAYVREILDFTDLNLEDFSKEVTDVFETPMKFFDALETTDFIGAYGDIRLRVKKVGTDDLIDYEDFSEGEQQLLTVIGLVLLFGNDDTLFLLDEPDTHLNPKWQRDYVKLLTDFNLDDNNSHILVATHSPLIVQAAEVADIFLFKPGTDSIVIDNSSHTIHNWRIDQVLASEYFEFISTRPSALDDYMDKRERIIYGNTSPEETEHLLQEFENEYGVLPTGETKIEIETMRLMKSITDNLRQNDQD